MRVVAGDRYTYYIQIREFADAFADSRMCAIAEVVDYLGDGRTGVVADEKECVDRILRA